LNSLEKMPSQWARAVLEFAGEDAFAVGVGDFLQLERAFQGDGMRQAVAEMVWDRTG